VDLNRPAFWLESEDEFGEYNTGLLTRVFLGNQMMCNIVHFRLPFCHYNFAENSEAMDKYLWNDEYRKAHVAIILPQLDSIVESDHVFIVNDIISSILFARDEASRVENFAPPVK
jgi:SpoVK/Ycf46/Vps4 family AAA+-type ATPase